MKYVMGKSEGVFQKCRSALKGSVMLPVCVSCFYAASMLSQEE